MMDETYVVNQVKEDVCFVSNDFKNDMEISHSKGEKNRIARDYILPDYTTIRRGYALLPNQPNQADNVIISSCLAAFFFDYSRFFHTLCVYFSKN